MLNIILTTCVFPIKCSMWTCPESAAAEDQLAALQSLRKQLRRTEKSLQTVEEELYR